MGLHSFHRRGHRGEKSRCLTGRGQQLAAAVALIPGDGDQPAAGHPGDDVSGAGLIQRRGLPRHALIGRRMPSQDAEQVILRRGKVPPDPALPPLPVQSLGAADQVARCRAERERRAFGFAGGRAGCRRYLALVGDLS